MGRKKHDSEEPPKQGLKQDVGRAANSAAGARELEDAPGDAGVDRDGSVLGNDTGVGEEESVGALLEQRIAELVSQAAEWKDRCFRTAAEADNVRRRTQRELEDGRKYANERLVSDLLPALDNLGRALEAAEQTSNFEALKTGVEQTQRQFSEALARAGLIRIEAVGQVFDPNQHEAILQVPAEGDQRPNEVVEELRPGYRLHDRVIRPSLVRVTVG